MSALSYFVYHSIQFRDVLRSSFDDGLIPNADHIESCLTNLEFFLSEVEDDRLSARLKELREANRELVDAVKSRDEAAVEMALTAHEKALNRIMAYTMSPEDFTRSTPGPRFEERDDEIARLKDEVLPDGSTRSFGQVRQIVEEKWPIMQNGKPLTTPAVHGAYKRKKSKKRN